MRHPLIWGIVIGAGGMWLLHAGYPRARAIGQ